MATISASNRGDIYAGTDVVSGEAAARSDRSGVSREIIFASKNAIGDIETNIRSIEMNIPMDSIRKFLLWCSVGIASISAVSSAVADGSSQPYSGGGRINVAAIIQKYNQSGERFRIEGSCQSSCTMLLAIRKACVDPSATLLFHAALFPNERGQKPPAARQAAMLNSYKPKLRSYLVSNGYVASFDFHSISGSDMIQRFGYTACPPP